MNEEKLLPCPFCGSDATLSRDLDDWQAECCDEECGAVTAYRVGPDAATAHWNRRVLPAEVREALEEYVVVMDKAQAHLNWCDHQPEGTEDVTQLHESLGAAMVDARAILAAYPGVAEVKG